MRDSSNRQKDCAQKYLEFEHTDTYWLTSFYRYGSAHRRAHGQTYASTHTHTHTLIRTDRHGLSEDFSFFLDFMYDCTLLEKLKGTQHHWRA